MEEMGHGLQHISPIIDNGILKANPILKSLNLAGNRLGDHGGCEFASLFSEPGCGLNELYLGGNRLGVTSGWALAEALGKSHHRLKVLNLEHNDFGEDCLGIVKHLKTQVDDVQYNYVKPSAEFVASDGYGGCCGCDMTTPDGSESNPHLVGSKMGDAELLCLPTECEDDIGCSDPRCGVRARAFGFKVSGLKEKGGPGSLSHYMSTDGGA